MLLSRSQISFDPPPTVLGPRLISSNFQLLLCIIHRIEREREGLLESLGIEDKLGTLEFLATNWQTREQKGTKQESIKLDQDTTFPCKPLHAATWIFSFGNKYRFRLFVRLHLERTTPCVIQKRYYDRFGEASVLQIFTDFSVRTKSPITFFFFRLFHFVLFPFFFF